MNEQEKKRMLNDLSDIRLYQIINGWILVVIMGILLVIMFFSRPAHAVNNPADMTASYGQIPFEFYKVCSDAGGTRWFDFSFPMGEEKDANLYFDNWISRDGSTKGLGIQVSKRLSAKAQTTFVNNQSWGSGGSSNSQTAWVDLSDGGFGASVLMPFEPGSRPTFGIRSDRGPLYGYLQYDTSDKSFFSGVSYKFRKSGTSLDLAYHEASETTYLRLSQSVNIDSGILIPEIRTKLGKTSYIGFGLAFVPK